MKKPLTVRPLRPADQAWLGTFVAERWGAPFVIARGELIVPADLPGLVAETMGELAGLLTYRVRERACEVVTLDSIRPTEGTGTILIEAVTALAREMACTRVWLITTNDNLDALRFYQRRGFRLVRVDAGAIERSRLLKPIPLVGSYGIPIPDELELERSLGT